MQALLPLLLETLERHGHLALDLEEREKLLTISSATTDRLLSPVRKISALQLRTPVQFNGWGALQEAGWLEIDLVAHCGKWMEARFLWPLVATDMATGWSECLPLLSRDMDSVMAALRMLEELLPLPLRGIDVGSFVDEGGSQRSHVAWRKSQATCDRWADPCLLTQDQNCAKILMANKLIPI